MSADRERWLAFLEEAVGFLALVGVAVARSASADRWATFAWLVGAYVAGMLVASLLLERRSPFGNGPRAVDGADADVRRGPAGLELVGAAVSFAALTIAYDRGALAPSVQWLGLAVVAAAAWTMGHGIAGAMGVLGLARRVRHATRVGEPTNAP